MSVWLSLLTEPSAVSLYCRRREDLSAGRHTSWPQKSYQDRAEVVSDVIQRWIEELLIPVNRRRVRTSSRPIPNDVEFITCQREMCVLGKTARAVPLTPLLD